jgi:hypothetical protein
MKGCKSQVVKIEKKAGKQKGLYPLHGEKRRDLCDRASKEWSSGIRGMDASRMRGISQPN